MGGRGKASPGLQPGLTRRSTATSLRAPTVTGGTGTGGSGNPAFTPGNPNNTTQVLQAVQPQPTVAAPPQPTPQQVSIQQDIDNLISNDFVGINNGLPFTTQMLDLRASDFSSAGTPKDLAQRIDDYNQTLASMAANVDTFLTTANQLSASAQQAGVDTSNLQAAIDTLQQWKDDRNQNFQLSAVDAYDSLISQALNPQSVARLQNGFGRDKAALNNLTGQTIQTRLTAQNRASFDAQRQRMVDGINARLDDDANGIQLLLAHLNSTGATNTAAITALQDMQQQIDAHRQDVDQLDASLKNQLQTPPARQRRQPNVQAQNPVAALLNGNANNNQPPVTPAQVRAAMQGQGATPITPTPNNPPVAQGAAATPTPTPATNANSGAAPQQPPADRRYSSRSVDELATTADKYVQSMTRQTTSVDSMLVQAKGTYADTYINRAVDYVNTDMSKNAVRAQSAADWASYNAYQQFTAQGQPIPVNVQASIDAANNSAQAAQAAVDAAKQNIGQKAGKASANNYALRTMAMDYANASTLGSWASADAGRFDDDVTNFDAAFSAGNANGGTMLHQVSDQKLTDFQKSANQTLQKLTDVQAALQNRIANPPSNATARERKALNDQLQKVNGEISQRQNVLASFDARIKAVKDAKRNYTKNRVNILRNNPVGVQIRARNAAKPRNADNIVQRSPNLPDNDITQWDAFKNNVPTMGALTQGVGSGSGNQDKFHGAMMEQLGYDETPDIHTKADMDNFIKNGDREIFRGIAGRTGSSQARIDDFIGGDLYLGVGFYGSGTYVAVTFNDAQNYAKPNDQYGNPYPNPFDDGSVMRLSIKKSAKYIRNTDAVRRAGQELQAFQRTPAFQALDAAGKQRVTDIYSNPGRWATMKGYDVLVSGRTDDNFIILNRSALRVQDEMVGTGKRKF